MRGFRFGRRWLVLVGVLVLVVPAVALAAASFDDVPASHTHFDGIEWMKTAGVTKGCDADSYCPDDAVTRAQMGTFMYRLAKFWGGEDGQVDAADHADDADTLQGSLPGALTKELEFSTTSTSLVMLDSMTVTVPGPGTMVFMASGGMQLDADATSASSLLSGAGFHMSMTSGGMGLGAASQVVYVQDADNASAANPTPGIDMTLVYQAPSAGTYTVYLNGYTYDASYTLTDWGTNLTALFLPGDGSVVLSGG